MSGKDFYLGRLVCASCRPCRWLRCISCGLLLSVCCIPVLASLDTEQELHISSQKLSDALIELGAQTELSIVFPSTLPLNEPSPAINGRFTPRQALNILLQNQTVQWQAFNSRVVSLSYVPAKPESTPVFLPTPLAEVIVIGKQVTGSRIKRLDLEGSAPVDIITDSEIAASGVQAVSDYLRFIPAVSGNSTSTAVSNGGDGTATITLRGLPAANTLVLLNGRRIANSGFGGDSVDLNSIQLAAVERIEVLKDGASAIYGSDAIAGVVNIIFKKEFDGLLVDQYFGQTSRGDFATSRTSFVGGFSTENSHFMLSLSHFDQDPIYSRDREISENADGRSRGGVDHRSSATPFSRITLPNNPDDPDDDQVVILSSSDSNPNLVSSYRPFTEEDGYNFREATSSTSPSLRSSAYFSLVNEIGDSSQLLTQAGYTETESQVTLASTPLFSTTEDPPLIVSRFNPYNPFGMDIIDIRRRLVELGPRRQTSTEKSERFSGTWESYTNNIHWDIAYNWSSTRAGQEKTGLVDFDRTRSAVSAECLTDPSCIPLDLFGPPGAITEEQINYIQAQNKFRGISKLYEISANADTSIDSWYSDPISIAGGLSRRRENAKLEALVTEFGNTKPPAIYGRRSIFEAYIEANIPLLIRQKYVNQLELEVATRYSHYSDFGDTTNPKLGLRYRPVADVLLRSTLSKGFRAPSLNQLNREKELSFDSLHDPCAIIENVGTLPGCSQQSDPSLRQFQVETTGNSELEPETSVSKTLGFVWTPQKINELYVSIDWFWVEQDDIIDSRPQFILDQNAEFGLFPDQIVRDAQGNIQRVIAKNLNVGTLQLKGVDASLRYQLLNKPFGNLVFSLNASHIIEYMQKLSPTSPETDLSGTFADKASAGVGAIPNLKLNAGISYSNENWEFNYNVFHVNKIEEFINSIEKARTIDSWTTQNLQLNYLVGQLKNTRLTLGIDNIFDQAPPFSAGAFNDNYDARTYEIKGRYWYGQVRYQF